jgi:hypothetical protein
VAEQPAEAVEQTEAAAAPASQRPRRAKAAPPVLFQPPEPDHPLPRQPRRTPDDVTTDTDVQHPEPPNGDAAGRPSGERPHPASGESADPASGDRASSQTVAPAIKPPKARAASVRKTAPRKAAEAPAEVTPTTPAPRKRAARSTKATKAATTADPTPAASPTKAADPTTAASPTKAADPTSAERTPTPDKSSATPPRPVPEQQPALGRTPESELRAVAARVLDHPGFAPELLALAAVRALGPGAAGWAARLRTRYPDASADGLARLATRRFVRSAGAGGATAALAGFFAPVAELAAVLWTHSELVLHLAAAYGKDPTHPDRAVDLLVLTQVHPDRASAEAALAAARTAGDPVEGGWPRAAEAAWRLAAPLTAQAGGWVALRLVARLLPGAAVLAAALGDAAAADRLAARAVAVYRTGPR